MLVEYNYSNYNVGSILLFKSNRKNAICSDYFNFYRLNGKDAISNDRILNQIISIVEKIVCYSKKIDNKLIVTCRIDFYTNINFTNASGNECNSFENNRLCLAYRNEFFSIETLISQLVSWFRLIYPEMTLSTNFVFNNQSVKYWINKYYQNEV